uniref:Uncharacterized protein n=1 Tax=Romanomermis culicivorax TaxID=13658 RepID=A0A915KKU4_ROMCU
MFLDFRNYGIDASNKNIIQNSYDLIIIFPTDQKNNTQFSTIQGIYAIDWIYYWAIVLTNFFKWPSMYSVRITNKNSK